MSMILTMQRHLRDKDEQAATEVFEQEVTVPRAQRLFQLYKNSYPLGQPGDRYYRSQTDVFRAKAKADGFTEIEIQALLLLQ
jgi:hypothetical protein